MKKSIALLAAAVFAAANLAPVAIAAEKGGKKPSAAECKKNPKLEGCEQAKK